MFIFIFCYFHRGLLSFFSTKRMIKPPMVPFPVVPVSLSHPDINR